MGPSVYPIIALGGPILLAKSLWYKVFFTLYTLQQNLVFLT
jgi:hypothetical protein